MAKGQGSVRPQKVIDCFPFVWPWGLPHARALDPCGSHKTPSGTCRLLCAYQFLVSACCAFRPTNSPEEGVRSSDSSLVIDVATPPLPQLVTQAFSIMEGIWGSIFLSLQEYYSPHSSVSQGRRGGKHNKLPGVSQVSIEHLHLEGDAVS